MSAVVESFEWFYHEISPKISSSFLLIMENEIHDFSIRYNFDKTAQDCAWNAFSSYFLEDDKMIFSKPEDLTFLMRLGVINMKYPTIMENLYIFAKDLYSLLCSEDSSLKRQ